MGEVVTSSIGFPRVLCGLVVLSLLLLCAGGNRLHAQASIPDAPSFQSDQTGWAFGFELFQMLLEERGLEVTTKLAPALAQPDASVIVVLGAANRRFSPADWASLVRFVQSGGRLLLACDGTLSCPGLGRFQDAPVTTNNPADQYRGFADCLWLPPHPQAVQEFSAVKHVVTNRSGWFVPQDQWFEWQTLVGLPRDCLPVAARSQPLLAIGSVRLPSRQVTGSNGLVVVSADPSLLSNGMLWHGDNSIAAIQISELLSSDRERLVFLIDGAVMNSYASRLEEGAATSDPAGDIPRELPEPELDKALRVANIVLKEVADSNVINEALRQQPRRVNRPKYLLTVLAIAGGLLMFGTVWKLWRTGRVNGSLLSPRPPVAAYQLAQARSGPSEYRAVAGQLSREFCFELTGSRNSADWQNYLAAAVSQSSGWEQSARGELARIVDIACRGCHARMSLVDLEQLGKALQYLRSKNPQKT